MPLLVVLHQVADYDAWRQVYDQSEPLQTAGGVLEDSVFRMTDDPSHVLVLRRFASADEAEAFLGSDEYRSAMARAGVKPDTMRVELFEEA